MHEELTKYAPISHPGLSDDISRLLDTLLGPEISPPIINKTQDSLRSNSKFQNLPERKTPRFLRIIASPSDNFAKHLTASDSNVTIMKWDVVRECVGDMADITKLPMSSVPPEV